MRKRNPHKTSDPRRDTEEAVAGVRQIYAELKANPPERHCTLQTECCRFHLTGQTPVLTKGEALTAAKAVRASGRKELPNREDGACPLLHPYTSRCMIYEGRPFGCRTHFCEAAGGPYTRKEVSWPIHAHIKIVKFDHMLTERIIQIALILHFISWNDDMASLGADPLDMRLEIEGCQICDPHRRVRQHRAG